MVLSGKVNNKAGKLAGSSRGAGCDIWRMVTHPEMMFEHRSEKDRAGSQCVARERGCQADKIAITEALLGRMPGCWRNSKGFHVAEQRER